MERGAPRVAAHLSRSRRGTDQVQHRLRQRQIERVLTTRQTNNVFRYGAVRPHHECAISLSCIGVPIMIANCRISTAAQNRDVCLPIRRKGDTKKGGSFWNRPSLSLTNMVSVFAVQTPASCKTRLGWAQATSYIMPPMPPMSGMPPPPLPPSFDGLSATIASVVISRPATDDAS